MDRLDAIQIVFLEIQNLTNVAGRIVLFTSSPMEERGKVFPHIGEKFFPLIR